jgi:cobalt/nickel transport system ATP-binding protein
MVVMDGGVIVADGTTKRILADADLLARHGLERP